MTEEHACRIFWEAIKFYVAKKMRQGAAQLTYIFFIQKARMGCLIQGRPAVK